MADQSNAAGKATEPILDKGKGKAAAEETGDDSSSEEELDEVRVALTQHTLMCQWN